MAKKVTVVGSFAVGMTLRTARMPIFGETLIGSDFDMGPGGKGSNQAVATARLGAHASFVSVIGNDKLAEIGTDLYRQEGVDTRFVRITDQMATGVGFIIVNPAGGNGIILDMGANMLMTADDVDSAVSAIMESDVVMSVLEVPAAAAVRAMELGNRHNIRTLLNPAPAIKLDPNVFQYIDYLTPNETELRILLGLAPDDPTPTLTLAQHLRAQGVRTIIVTQGAKGCIVISGDDVTEVPGLAMNVVDTTGAGDAFSSGLAVALIEGRPLLDAVHFATCCGALACTKLGVIPSLARRAEADALYRQRYGA